MYVGKLWSRSMKVAYYILHKLGTKQEPIVRPGDRVSVTFYLLTVTWVQNEKCTLSSTK